MELSLITNDPGVVEVAESAGVDRVFIDLERLGKAQRQHGLKLFLSEHQPTDIVRVRQRLTESRLMVRIDPPHFATRAQVDFAIESGADFVMLPYFQSVEHAREFIDYVDGRAKAVLLVETREAADALPVLVESQRLSEIHLGLNDLSISFGRRFLFDLISDGTVDRLCQIMRDADVPFGFGGIGSLSRTELPVSPDMILGYQVCQGATRGWLGRTFRETPIERLPDELRRLRERISFWRSASDAQRACLESVLFSQIESASGAFTRNRVA